MHDSGNSSGDLSAPERKGSTSSSTAVGLKAEVVKDPHLATPSLAGSHDETDGRRRSSSDSTNQNAEFAGVQRASSANSGQDVSYLIIVKLRLLSTY